MAKTPKCLNCQSKDLIYPGFCSFHFRRGRWVVERSGAEMADGASMHCQKCGAKMGFDDPNDPAATLTLLNGSVGYYCGEGQP